jgi:hypothetical protein
MNPNLTPSAFLTADPATDAAATYPYLIHVAPRSAPEEHRVECIAARNEAHAREISAYLFADSVVLRIRPERRRAAAYPDARFIKGEFLPTTDGDTMVGAGAD